MMGIDYKVIMQKARDFIAANLAACCGEELDWQNTALLCDGKLREAAAIYAQVDAPHALSIAQSETARQAMQAAAAHGEPLSQQSESERMIDKIAELHKRVDAAYQQGRAAGIEEAAKLIDQHQETNVVNSADGVTNERTVTPRKAHNMMGLAYATAIRALAAKPSEALQPEVKP